MLPLSEKDEAVEDLRPTLQEQASPYSDRDIVAQETMADASVAMAFAALLTVAVTIVGTIYLVLQVRLTRKALESTDEATAAMGIANSIAQDSSERQLRAYFGILSGEVEDFEPHDPVIAMTMVNHGQTPAYNVRYHITKKVCRVKDRPSVPKVKRLRNKPWEQVGPGAALLERCYFGELIDEETKPLNMTGELRLYVAGILQYSDCFGKSWIYRFRLRSAGKYFRHGLLEGDFHGEAEIPARYAGMVEEE